MTATATDQDRFLERLGRGPVLMGILNVTPDSFSDGGRHSGLRNAIAHAERMQAEGAEIIDIGGESTRPGHGGVSAHEELDRVVPVLAALRGRLAVPLSIDTQKATVARAAIGLGASVINDIWGLQGDPEMARVAAETGAAVIAMHNRDRAEDGIDIMADMMQFFERTLQIAADAGIPANRLILDPGVGFGKTYEQNLTTLRDMGRLRTFGLPVLLGVSRKSFIGRALGLEVEERLTGTLIADLVGLRHGADILRVHDVAEHKQMLDMLALLGEPA